MSPTDLAQLYAIAVAGLAGLVIPAVVDLITKSHLADGAKALIATVLSAAAGALATVTITPGVHWQTVALSMVSSFVAAMGAHQTGYSRLIQNATAGFGVGPADPPADAPPPPAPSGSAGYALVELLIAAFIAVLIAIVVLRAVH